MTFSLSHNSIPTDGSGRVRVTDIGDTNGNALICHSGIPISSNGNWYLHPTEMSTDDGDRIGSGGVPDRGWRGYLTGNARGHRLVRLRRDSDTAEEGVFTCDIPGEFNTPVFVGIYYPCESYMYTESPVRVTCTQAISNQSLYTHCHILEVSPKEVGTILIKQVKVPGHIDSICPPPPPPPPPPEICMQCQCLCPLEWCQGEREHSQ